MSGRYTNLEQSFLGEVEQIAISGVDVVSRGSLCREKIFSNIVIYDPTDLAIEFAPRNFNVAYAISEFLWYLSANRSVINIGKMASTWGKIADQLGEVESNYGTYFKRQWQWVVDELVSDENSRRATLTINQPHHKVANPQDYPCTMSLQFLIRQGQLHMHVNMRSNDAVFGYCNDVFNFCLFQQMMLNELRMRGLSVKLGHYYHSAGSLHVYERHFLLMEKVCEEMNGNGGLMSKRTREHEVKLVLRPEVTWNYVLERGLHLPNQEISKEEIVKMTQAFVRNAFL